MGIFGRKRCAKCKSLFDLEKDEIPLCSKCRQAGYEAVMQGKKLTIFRVANKCYLIEGQKPIPFRSKGDGDLCLTV